MGPPERFVEPGSTTDIKLLFINKMESKKSGRAISIMLYINEINLKEDDDEIDGETTIEEEPICETVIFKVSNGKKSPGAPDT